MQADGSEVEDDFDPDFEDVDDLDAILAEDAEIEKILKTSEELDLPDSFFEEEEEEEEAELRYG
ncbi:MAG: hypothetical protein EOM20_02205 [Spartobacteria bacterium]|nr:hypothetical protein [Spartobacteria bacterium]